MGSRDRIDGEGLAAWIAEHADVDLDVVKDVLELEQDYMVAAGIAFADDYIPRHYTYNEVAGSKGVDIERLSHDAERKLNVRAELAHRILTTESKYLVMRGLG